MRATGSISIAVRTARVTVIAALVSACALPWTGAAPSGIPHDGYTLACEDVGQEMCRRSADREAKSWRQDAAPGQEIRWIVVRPEQTQVCGSRGALIYCYESSILESIG